MPLPALSSKQHAAAPASDDALLMMHLLLTRPLLCKRRSKNHVLPCFGRGVFFSCCTASAGPTSDAAPITMHPLHTRQLFWKRGSKNPFSPLFRQGSFLFLLHGVPLNRPPTMLRLPCIRCIRGSCSAREDQKIHFLPCFGRGVFVCLSNHTVSKIHTTVRVCYGIRLQQA